MEIQNICKTIESLNINFNGSFSSYIKNYNALLKVSNSVDTDMDTIRNLWDKKNVEFQIFAILLLQKHGTTLNLIYQMVFSMNNWYVCDLFFNHIIKNKGVSLISRKELRKIFPFGSRIYYSIILQLIHEKKNAEDVKILGDVKIDEIDNTVIFPKLLKCFQTIEVTDLHQIKKIKDLGSSKNIDKIVLEMQYSLCLHLLKKKSDNSIKANMSRIGIPVENSLGVSLSNMRKISKTFYPNNSLSKRLFQNNIHEAKIIATMIANPRIVTKMQIERIAEQFDSWDFCDLTCRNLIEKTKFLDELIIQWCPNTSKFIKRAGFVLIARKIIISKNLISNEQLNLYFNYILKYADDDRFLVKKAISWALRQIGKTNELYRHQAINICRILKESNNRNATWVANDALREFNNITIKHKTK
jgi:3-methyladenine DNA glycosylase AlkD